MNTVDMVREVGWVAVFHSALSAFMVLLNRGSIMLNSDVILQGFPSLTLLLTAIHCTWNWWTMFGIDVS